MLIIWDEPKRQTNLTRRGLDFAALDFAFFEEAMITKAKLGRFRATGTFGFEMITVIFAVYGTEALSVMSMRRASRKERSAYDAR